MSSAVNGYSVSDVNGCKVIKGAIPVDDVVALTDSWRKRYEEGCCWIMDTLLAHHMGAALVVGPESACMAWRGSLNLVPPVSPSGQHANLDSIAGGHGREPG
jgi:hypothetical protein